MTILRARYLTAEAFEPYGRVMRPPQETEHASGPGWRWWAETMLLQGDGRPFGVGYLDLEPDELRFDWAERHLRSLEAIVPLAGEILVYVGPPEDLDEPERLPRLERFEVFRVPPGTGVVMDPGVWHGAPLCQAPTRAMVLLLEGTGQQDVTLVRFEDRAVEVEV